MEQYIQLTQDYKDSLLWKVLGLILKKMMEPILFRARSETFHVVGNFLADIWHKEVAEMLINWVEDDSDLSMSGTNITTVRKEDNKFIMSYDLDPNDEIETSKPNLKYLLQNG